MAQIYPLPMRFPAQDWRGDIEIAVEIGRDGWKLDGPTQKAFWAGLPVAERLRLRREFAAQVELAQNTPTKGRTPCPLSGRSD
jgi:hypothetical protein